MSYGVSKLFKKPIHWGMPSAIAIEPTTSCNLRCPECPSGLRSFTRATGMLEKNFFENFIQQIKSKTFYLTFYFQGEPYLNKDFLDMVSIANKNKLFATTSTNGHYLTNEVAKKTVESGLGQLIISIDGTTQETYEKYRIGGQLSKVEEGVQNLVKWKKELQSSTPHIIIQFVVFKSNEHQINDVKALKQKWGVDEVKLKTAQFYEYENGNELMPENLTYSRYAKNNDGTYQMKNTLENSCWKMWHSCVITWDGKVVPCCFDKDAHYVLGNVSENTFEKVWRSEPYNVFRAKVLHSRSNIEMCKNCSEGALVWV